MSTDNPFAAPSFNTELAIDRQQLRDYGGIRRLPFFLYGFLAYVLLTGTVILVVLFNGTVSMVLVAQIAFCIAGIWLTIHRLRNLGYGGWWTLGLFVPLLNILIWLRCVAAPEGYADHKTLDTPGKMVIGVFLGLFVLGVIGVVIARFGAA